MLTPVVDKVLPAGLLVLGIVALVLSCTNRKMAPSRLPLPPGPRPLPLVGNLFDMPTKNMIPSFRRMAEKYGELVYLNVVGRPIVIIDSYDAAVALLEQRSAHTSDRPHLVMPVLTGITWQFSAKGYTPTWRRQRRMFHDFFHQGALPQYRSIHRRESKKLLGALLDAPEDFLARTHLAIGGTVLDTVYGMDDTDDINKFVSIAEKGAKVFRQVIVPGRFLLVELFPWLAALPVWFPGAGFKRDTRGWKDWVLAVRDFPFDSFVGKMARGCARPCIAYSLMESAGTRSEKTKSLDADDEVHFREVTGVAYVAGVGTTYVLMMAFFLAMVNFPEAQRRAQAELDAVVGPDRLPDFSDRDSLPYVNALLKECVRWLSILPLGLPHATTEEEEFNGFRIPAGSVLITNVWAMSRDPVAYPDPASFQPERFLKHGQLDSSVRDPFKFQFGFGRRICPGRYFALDSAFLMVASILHVFEIKPPVDKDGSPMKVNPKIPMDYVSARPEPFSCRIVPRSATMEALVRQTTQNNAE